MEPAAVTAGAAASTTPTSTSLTKNPYVGPTSFRAGDPLYGRTHERDDLLDLLIAERIVLLYSPSGAGKTSLLQAALVQSLVDARFEVLPIIRVTHTLPSDGLLPAPRNRYVMSTLLSLEEGVPKDLQHPVAALARTSLVEYLRRWPDLDGRPGNEVLIFDQFEEVLTADPTDEDAKREFFTELGEVLRNRQHWAIFAMREDFLAALDPYLRYIPTRFRTRYRLDLLTADAALEAVVNPARDAGVTFARDAAVNLVDDLRRVLVQRPDGAEQVLGPYVEPVQLQVACNLLWSRLPAGATAITQADDTVLGGVEEALGRYYAERVATAAGRTGIHEGVIRDWFEGQLITPQGLRGQVLAGPLGGGEGDRELLAELVDAHLVRPERRRLATWFELAHDRFIEPVKHDNATWRLEHQTPFERAAMVWESERRPDRLLLVGPALFEAERTLVQRTQALGSREGDFLAASRAADQRMQRDRRNARVARRLTWALGVAVLLSVSALVLTRVALSQAEVAKDEVTAAKDALADQEQEQRLLYGVHSNLTWDQETAVALAAAWTREVEVPLDRDTRELLYEAVSVSPVTFAMPGHDGPVPSVALSADGLTAVTADSRGVYSWDRPTRERREFAVPDGRSVIALDTSRDGTRFAAALDGGSIAVWDAASGSVRSWDTGSGVSSVALSPDGDHVASVSAGSSVEVWDARGTLVSEVGPDSSAVSAIFSPDGGLLATVDTDANALVWDATSGEERGRVAMPAKGVSVQFGADPSTIATVDVAGTATVWDWASASAVHSLADDAGADVRAVSADLARVLSMTSWGEVRIFDMATGIEVGETWVPDAELVAAAFDPADSSGVLVLPAKDAPAVWQTQPPTSRFLSAASLEDGGLFSVWDDGRVRVTDSTGSNRDTPIIEPDGVVVMDVDTEGKRLAVATAVGDVHVWDVDTGARLLLLDDTEPRVFTNVEFFPDGSKLVTADDDARVTVWDARSGGKVRDLVDLNWASVVGLAVSPDGAQVLVARGPAAGAYGVRAAPNDAEPVAMLLFVETTASVDLRLGELARSAAEPAPDVMSGGAFSVDGQRVAVVTEQGAAAVFDTVAGGQRWAQELHPNGASAVRFTPDGRLVTVVGDRSVLLTDGETGDPLREVPSTSMVVSGALTPDGQHLEAYSYSGSRTVMPLDDAALIEMVQHKVVHDLTAAECARWGVDGC